MNTASQRVLVAVQNITNSAPLRNNGELLAASLQSRSPSCEQGPRQGRNVAAQYGLQGEADPHRCRCVGIHAADRGGDYDSAIVRFSRAANV